MLISNDRITTATPYFMNLKNAIGWPSFAAFSETITLAAAPMIVQLPPKQAPSDKLHHNGVV